MSYPLPVFYEENDSVMRDLEYLQQMYPAKIKKYQKRISQILDYIDYHGSIIYDEYPDKWMLFKLAREISEAIRTEERQEPEHVDWEGFEDTIQILLFYEIYKRRHSKQKGFMNF